jgi:hypothetical protein
MCITWLFFSACVGSGYYAASNGSDNNNCVSATTACASLTKILTFSSFEHAVQLLYSNLPYKVTTTTVNDKYLILFSDEASPTSVIFSYSASANTPLISITSGKLLANTVKFIYDASAVDAFISILGTGSVEMEYVVVTANTTNPTIALKSFIVVSGGGSVSLTEFRLETFKSNVPVISLAGWGSFLTDGVVVTNATFTGTGVFVLANSHLCDVALTNSNFSSLTGVNGTVARIDGANINFVVSKCIVGTAIKAGNGGAFYLGDCFVAISSSSFSDCTTSGGKGGAIYFGVASRFGLVNCTFSSCSATYGGAIFSESEDPSGRVLNELNFSSNTVTATGNGNDIADNSTLGISLYSSLTVTNCVSSSTASGTISNFFLFQGSQIFDCLLTSDGCLFDIFYVSTTGFDSYTCGHESNPCKSLTQTVYNLNVSVVEEAVVHVASGEYTDTYLSVSSVNLSVLKSSESKPVLSLLTPPAGLACVFRRFMMFSFRLLRYYIAGVGER